MSWPHSPWPLFTADLELARAWLQPQLEGSSVQLQTGHTALSLGMVGAVQALLAQPDHLPPGAAATWGFRLARLQGAANPYATLVPNELQEAADQAINASQASGHPLAVTLFGGLGDHLEALSLLLPWARRQGIPLQLHTSPERQQQLAPVVGNGGDVCWSDRPGLADKALRCSLMGRPDPPPYASWIGPADEPPTAPQGLLCCWRAVGAGDLLSAHSRSVPLGLVEAFVQRQCAQTPDLPIFDISQWQPWEADRLRALGVELLDPRQGGLGQLVRLCRSHRVVTIDTALAHLCAAMGHPATVLVPRFADERWQELDRPQHSYGQWLQRLQSAHFGCWASLMSSPLLGSLPSV